MPAIGIRRYYQVVLKNNIIDHIHDCLISNIVYHNIIDLATLFIYIDNIIRFVCSNDDCFWNAFVMNC